MKDKYVSSANKVSKYSSDFCHKGGLMNLRDKILLASYREYIYNVSVAVYQKYLTRLGELIIFLPWRGNYYFSQ